MIAWVKHLLGYGGHGAESEVAAEPVAGEDVVAVADEPVAEVAAAPVRIVRPRPPTLTRHAKRLLDLRKARERWVDERRQLEADRDEGVLAPIALEIEGHAAAAAAAASRVGALDDVDQTIATFEQEATSAVERLRSLLAEAEAEREMIAGVREILDEAKVYASGEEKRVGELLVAARARFEAASTTPRLKHVRASIGRIDAQIAKIVERRPDAAITDLQRRIDEEAVRQGVAGRIQKVDAAFRSPEFGKAFNEAVAEFKGSDRDPRSVEDVRNLAFEVLGGMGVDTDDVLVTVFWSGPEGNSKEGLPPNTLRFTTRGMTPQAHARCRAAVLGAADIRQGRQAA
jgi:hypothetical protein